METNKKQVVQPEVSRIKFDKEIAEFLLIEDDWRKKGVICLKANFPTIEFIFIAPHTKPQTVAFGGKNGNTFMLYVQAKKLFLPSLTYNSLLHAAPNPTEQLDKLILNKFFYPIGLPIYPIYVFYNYLPKHPSLITCNCGENLPVQLSGCSYADAFSIRNEMLAGNNHFNDYAKYQYAWSCLVCCDGNKSKSNSNTDLATSYFNRIVNKNIFNETQATKIEVKNQEPFNAESFLLKQPPSFVNQIISGKELEYNPFKELGVENITVLQELENNNSSF